MFEIKLLVIQHTYVQNDGCMHSANYFAMNRLPSKLLDMILQFVCLGEAQALYACVLSLIASSADSYCRSQRFLTHKTQPLNPSVDSDGGPELAIDGVTSSHPRYKSLRFVFPSFYTRILFNTVIIYPHAESSRHVCAIAYSPLASHIQRVIFHLPFFSYAMATSCGRDILEDADLDKYWRDIPVELGAWLKPFENLDSVIAVPSWMRRRR